MCCDTVISLIQIFTILHIMSNIPTHLKEDSKALRREHAEALDKEDPLNYIRSEFIVPTKADLKRRTLAKSRKHLPFLEQALSDTWTCGQKMQPKNHVSISVGIL